MFEWNQQLKPQKKFKPPTIQGLFSKKSVENSEVASKAYADPTDINYDKLSTLTMLALNYSYLTCPGFDFDQDLTTEELPFKFDKKECHAHHSDEDSVHDY